MATLALVLQDPIAARVRSAWAMLEHRFGLDEVRKVPFPHVTLLGYEGVAQPAVLDLLREISHATQPLQLETRGLNRFADPAPVVYASILASRELIDLQALLWHRLGRLGADRFAIHAPAVWVPHVTLAQGRPLRGDPGEIAPALAEHGLDLAFEVRNLTLFDWLGPRYEPCERFPLLGGMLARSLAR